MKIHTILIISFILTCSPSVYSQSGYIEGLSTAVNNYSLNELIKKAKRSDPNSKIPSMIEHMLTGLSMIKDPKVIMEATYPGALAANAIGQLIERHGKDIANMTYTESKVFIGDDTSMIPNDSYTGRVDAADSLCKKMFNTDGSGDISLCRDLVEKLMSCRSKNGLKNWEIQHCNERLAAFYDLMEYHGKSELVREAGRVATAELKSMSNNVANESVAIGTQPVCKSFTVSCLDAQNGTFAFHYPDRGTVVSGPKGFTVGPRKEISGYLFGNVTTEVDVVDDGINFVFNDTGCCTRKATFNGIVLRFTDATFPGISDVSLGSTNIVRFGASRITSTAKEIRIDLGDGLDLRNNRTLKLIVH